MDKVLDYSYLQTIVSNIRNNSKAFTTNYYPNEIKDKRLILLGALFVESIGNTCFIIKQMDGFYELAFVSTDIESLIKSSSLFIKDRTEVFVTDIIGTDIQVKELSVSFIALGFRQRRVLQRMIKIGKDEASQVDSVNVVPANINDTSAIHTILLENFDSLTEKIPSVEELEKFVGDNQIFLYKDNNNIAGLIIFELTASVFYLRYWYTSNEYRNKGIGSSLYKKVMYLSGKIKRQMLWVVADNENAIKRYESYGFKPDKLSDIVLTINA